MRGSGLLIALCAIGACHGDAPAPPPPVVVTPAPAPPVPAPPPPPDAPPPAFELTYATSAAFCRGGGKCHQYWTVTSAEGVVAWSGTRFDREQGKPPPPTLAHLSDATRAELAAIVASPAFVTGVTSGFACAHIIPDVNRRLRYRDVDTGAEYEQNVAGCADAAIANDAARVIAILTTASR